MLLGSTGIGDDPDGSCQDIWNESLFLIGMERLPPSMQRSVSICRRVHPG
jgi:hypothetical protein